MKKLIVTAVVVTATLISLSGNVYGNENLKAEMNKIQDAITKLVADLRNEAVPKEALEKTVGELIAAIKLSKENLPDQVGSLPAGAQKEAQIKRYKELLDGVHTVADRLEAQ